MEYPAKLCSCAVGLSGICCHVLALLLFLKHYHETGERILALTSTEQLQKWRRCSHKSSIPVVLLTELKVNLLYMLKEKEVAFKQLIPKIAQ